MKGLERRLAMLEGGDGYYSIGELLDALDGPLVAAGKSLHPGLLSWLASLKECLQCEA